MINVEASQYLKHIPLKHIQPGLYITVQTFLENKFADVARLEFLHVDVSAVTKAWLNSIGRRHLSGLQVGVITGVFKPYKIELLQQSGVLAGK